MLKSGDPDDHDLAGGEQYHHISCGNLQRPHCDLTGIMINKENHPQVALIQLSEIL